jgi:hypothetical protein
MGPGFLVRTQILLSREIYTQPVIFTSLTSSSQLSLVTSLIFPELFYFYENDSPHLIWQSSKILFIIPLLWCTLSPLTHGFIFMVSVVHSQLWSKNIKWKIPEITHKFLISHHLEYGVSPVPLGCELFFIQRIYGVYVTCPLVT